MGKGSKSTNELKFLLKEEKQPFFFLCFLVCHIFVFSHFGQPPLTYRHKEKIVLYVVLLNVERKIKYAHFLCSRAARH